MQNNENNENNENNKRRLSNIEYYNHKYLIDNTTYALLSKLKAMGENLPSNETGLDYYKMWVSQYSRNAKSITSKNNVEMYVYEIAKKRINFFKILDFLKKSLKNILADCYDNQILNCVIEFIFDNENIIDIKKKYKLTTNQLITRLEVISKLLVEYWR